MNKSFKHGFLTLIFASFGFLGFAGPAHADCSSAPPGVALRIWTAPAWCPHCQHQEAFMRGAGMTRSIPFLMNDGRRIDIAVQVCDVDDAATGEQARRLGINGLPTNQVLIDGSVSGDKKEGALLSIDAFERFFNARIPGGDRGSIVGQSVAPGGTSASLDPNTTLSTSVLSGPANPRTREAAKGSVGDGLGSGAAASTSVVAAPAGL